jgi:OHCU decarboxylase
LFANRDWLEAFAAHPRIGAKKKAPSQGARAAAWSKGEQRDAAAASKDVLQQLSKLNEQYFKKFGFIYIVCATGKSAEEMLELLELRVKRSKSKEIEAAAVEQSKITKLRIEKWLIEHVEKYEEG